MNTGRQPETVKAYLDALTGALKARKCPAGLISDALADAEEHLNNEISTHPELSEAAVLASVIETYGTPEEIAEEYKSMEATISGPFPKAELPTEKQYGFFGIIRDPRAYGALLYMLLSLITGVAYFVFVITGVALSFGLFITLIGIPLGLLVIGMARLIAHAEGRLVEGLLGVRMPRRLPAQTATDETIMVKIKEALLDVRTWSSMLYLVMMLPIGIAYFVIALVGTVVPLALIGGSISALVTGRSNIQIDDVPWLEHLFHTAPGLVLLMAVGALLFFVTLHIARGIGWMHGKIAELLLVRL